MAKSKGISLKKRYGQHFLRDEHYVQSMFDAVTIDGSTSVLEIGCGDGFLTAALLQQPIARVWVYEIDQQWADYVAQKYPDPRLVMHHTNFLDADLHTLAADAPWTVLANLPYQVTFPILHRFQEYRQFLKEGVVMVQEEVAQKITKTSGRGYGYPSLFFQHYFTWKLLDKVPRTAFYPPPKVESRLLYFKPIAHPEPILDEAAFWLFIKRCFKQPRRTIRNNLKGLHYGQAALGEDILSLRAQQMNMQQLLTVWQQVKDSAQSDSLP